MKIDGFPGNVSKIYQANQVKAEGAGKKSPLNINVPDSVELTDQARQIHELVKDTKALPDVREERIAQIKAEIDSGTYNVTAEQLAAKMLAAIKE